MHLFAAACAELAAGHPEHVGGVRVAAPAGPGWFDVDRLEPAIGDALDRFVAESHGRRAVAATHVCAEVAELLVWPLVTSVVLTGRAWTYRSPGTLVHDRWDAVALPYPHLAVLGGDPLLHLPVEPGGAVVALDDVDALVAWSAEELAPVLVAIVDAVRSGAPYGRRGLWAIVAGEVTFAALVAAHRSHGDDRDAARIADALLSHLELCTGELVPRPPTTAVPTRRGRRLAPTKATCCLRDELDAFDGDPDPLCLTCPRRPVPDRSVRYSAWLDRLLGQAPVAR